MAADSQAATKELKPLRMQPLIREDPWLTLKSFTICAPSQVAEVVTGAVLTNEARSFARTLGPTPATQ